MEPWWLLERWMHFHGALTKEQRQSFLAREEVGLLCKLDEALVEEALQEEPKLAKVLELARDRINQNKARAREARNVREAERRRDQAAKALQRDAETARRTSAKLQAEADSVKKAADRTCKACGLVYDYTGQCACT